VLIPRKLQEIGFLPGTGFLALEKERWVPHNQMESACSKNPSALNYQHLDVFTGELKPSNIKSFRRQQTRADGRTGWPDRDPSSIDKDGNVYTFEVEIEERTSAPGGEPTRHLQYRELDGRILVDLPVAWGKPRDIGGFLAIEAKFEGERRLALMGWCKSDLHWTPPGTTLFKYDGGDVYDDIYRLSAPVPETEPEDDLWLFLTPEKGFSAPDGVVGFTPMRSAPKNQDRSSLIVECEWIWLVRYPVDNENDPLARRWGLHKTFNDKYTPPTWTHQQIMHDQFAIDVADTNTPPGGRDELGYACEIRPFIALRDVDENWHLVDSNPRFDFMENRQTRYQAYLPGPSGEFDKMAEAINRRRSGARRSVDRAQLRKAVKSRSGQAIEFWAIRVGDDSVYDQVRIAFPDASQEMLAAAISALSANGFMDEAAEFRAQFNETEAFIARARAAKAQREALFARLAAEENARIEARRRAHALTLRQPNSSASWSGGHLPRWTPSESQRMDIFRYNLDQQIKAAGR
ncbi:MAG: hypothetical protein P1V35_14215, partial [Planctomycetota bacterium]|nr:hypothetical protein [Planctomycetota bacterium]